MASTVAAAAAPAAAPAAVETKSAVSSVPSDITFNYTGKLVLVTGSTLGIGRAIAEGFVRSGARVIVNGRTASSVISTTAQLNDLAKGTSTTYEPRVFGIVGDVGTTAGAESVAAAVDKIGFLDVLVNNVGIFYSKDFFTVTDDEWMNIFNVNVMSTVRLSRHFLKAQLAANKGRIIIIGSETGARPLGHMIHYSTTKTALMGVARGLAELTKGTAVTVNNVLAGPTYTEGVLDYLVTLWNKDHPTEPAPVQDELVAAYFRDYEKTSLLQRFITTQEMSTAVLFLASSLAGAITGSNMRVEGGIIRSIGS